MLKDEDWLRRTISLSIASRAAGHHPFAALIVSHEGEVLAQAMNAHHLDRVSHAEMMALREASARYTVAQLRTATLYSSAEPCAMCSGGLYWAGIGRLVYALSEQSLLRLTGNHPENPTLSLPCRTVLAAGQRIVEVVGPMLEDEAAEAHAGFWMR